MLWKCCTQYASKFGKLSSGHRTGKGEFSFQSQRKAMPKNAQTTTHLQSSHMLVKYCSKFSKLVFNSTWTENLQIFKLDLKRQRNKRSNCQHLLDHRKCKRIPEKHLLLPYWLWPKPLTVWIILWKILKELGTPDHLTCLLSNVYAGKKATVRVAHGTKDWFKIRTGIHQA